MRRTTIAVVLLLFGWGCADGTGDRTSESPPGSGQESTKMKIDHFMYAVADLDEGMAWAAEAFGVAPVFGGSHEGLGTRNALLSLGDTYLEIIAPDPAQAVESQMVTGMGAMSGGGFVTWAAQGDLIVTKGFLEEAGISSVGPVETRRRTADDGLLVWDLLFPQGGGYGTPFFIDWRIRRTRQRRRRSAGSWCRSRSPRRMRPSWEPCWRASGWMSRCRRGCRR